MMVKFIGINLGLRFINFNPMKLIKTKKVKCLFRDFA